MAGYRYAAKSLEGKRVRGTLLAADEEHAYQRVKESGYFPMWIREIRPSVRKAPLSARQMADFCGRLAAILKSGIPLDRALELLRQKENRKSMAGVYQRLHEDLNHGIGFADALRAQGRVFSPLFIGMFQAGEADGRLDEAAARLAELYEKDSRLEKRVRTSMMYPGFLLIMTIACLLLVFTVILPEFFDLFGSMEELPLSTRSLLFISRVMTRYYMEILCGLTAVTALSAFLLQRPGVRVRLDQSVLKLPFLGRLMRTICTARFARTLGTLYAGGLPFLQAVSAAFGVTGNRYIESQRDAVLEHVKNGVGLSDALSFADGLDSRMILEVYIGEEVGALDELLKKTADRFDLEAGESAVRMAALAEPVMIILMAVVIGCVMLSVMLPIYQYYRMLG